MNGRRIWTAALAAFLCWGCNKSVSYDTMYVLRPYVQQTNGDGMESLPRVKAFAFDADTTMWTVASYEDALRGILTMRYASSQKRSDALAVAEPFPPIDTIPASVNWLQMRILLPSAMILAVDVENRLYGYRQQEFSQNVSPYVLSVAFRPWKEANFYKDGDWWMFDDYYTKPVEPDNPDNPDEPDAPVEPDEPDEPAATQNSVGNPCSE